jgi:hypothetical protein
MIISSSPHENQRRTAKQQDGKAVLEKDTGQVHESMIKRNYRTWYSSEFELWENAESDAVAELLVKHNHLHPPPSGYPGGYVILERIILARGTKHVVHLSCKLN